MKTKIILMMVSLLWFLFPSYAKSAEFVMGVEDISYLPYYSVDNGEYNGYSRTLLDAFARDKGHHITYLPLPVERLFHSLLNGSIDFKYPDNQEWRRELKANADIHYSEPVAHFTDGVMVAPKRLQDPIDSFRRIGTIRGFTPWTLLDRVNSGKVVISENNSISGLLRQVIASRVDGAYINIAVARYQLKDILGQKDALIFDKNLPSTNAAYLVSTIKHPDILLELNAWMEKNKSFVSDLQKKFDIE